MVAASELIDSEHEGLYLRDLEAGDVVEIFTQNRVYRMIYEGDGEAMISGHPEFCPEPIPVKILGSTWGGSMIKTDFIGCGMHLEFRPAGTRRVTTSRILEIRAPGVKWRDQESDSEGPQATVQ